MNIDAEILTLNWLAFWEYVLKFITDQNLLVIVAQLQVIPKIGFWELLVLFWFIKGAEMLPGDFVSEWLQVCDSFPIVRYEYEVIRCKWIDNHDIDHVKQKVVDHLFWLVLLFLVMLVQAGRKSAHLSACIQFEDSKVAELNVFETFYSTLSDGLCMDHFNYFFNGEGSIS